MVALSALADNSRAPEAVGPVPTAAQVAWQRLETYAFIHFGPNTFTDMEWGYGDTPAEAFNPTRLDCEQWVQTIVKAGMKGVILTCKHHDGFCLWPSRYTDYSVASSPFKRDVVRELSDACKKYGIRFGVYLSPWDRHQASYGTPEYVTYYYNQLEELMTQYGDIFEVWFDGANGGDGWYGGAKETRKIPQGYYRFDEVYRFVRELQPKVTIFCGEGEYRWPGNERGDVDPVRSAVLDGNFCQWEADFPLRPGWFYHASERGRTKHAAYLMNRYLSSVGNGGTMDIGIAPNREGRLDDEDVRALRGFKAIKDAFFAHPAKDGEEFNFVETKDEFGVKRLYISSDRAIRGKRYLVDPELIQLVRTATTDSGETDTAKWMTGAEKERK